jgi:hypothetical protein
MTYSDSMQQLNQNVLRPQMPQQQQPQVDLFGSFDIKKPTTPLASSNLTTANKVKFLFLLKIIFLTKIFFL